jgi:ribosomal protein S18 acetylase RimI-like enzyme
VIIYKDSIDNTLEENFQGFFVNWPNPPSVKVFLELLKYSDYFVIAVDETNGKTVGFITSISDRVLTVYIPLLEVLPEYQGMGIGSELVRRVFEKFDDFYKIDLCCDEELQDYYSGFGMVKVFGMTRKKYEYQNGRRCIE